MSLKLRVTGYDTRQIGAAAEHVFGDAGGTIGRASSNDWHLPDPVISGKHAVIRCDNGEYYLRDTSSNGTLVNTMPLSRGDERPLHHGDILRIGNFNIAVEIEPSRANRSVPSVSHSRDLFADAGHAKTLDPLELLGSVSQTAEAPFPPEGFDFGRQDSQSDHVSAEAQGFQPPRSARDPSPFRKPTSGPVEIPADWDETGSDSEPEPPPPPPRVSQPPPQRPVPMPAVVPGEQEGGSDSINTLLHAAGVPPHSINPETYKLLGQIIQVVVQGMVDILRARAQIKDEFRVAATRLKPVENNPLKFSINAHDALHNLFGKSNPGYQSPVAAFQDGFEDVKAHQLAMIAGMRAAYEAMLNFFDPEELETEFDRRMKRGVLGNVLSKPRYWEMYEELYQNLTRDPDSSFQRLFGDQFGKAYESQLDKLSDTRNH